MQNSKTEVFSKMLSADLFEDRKVNALHKDLCCFLQHHAGIAVSGSYSSDRLS